MSIKNIFLKSLAISIILHICLCFLFILSFEIVKFLKKDNKIIPEKDLVEIEMIDFKTAKKLIGVSESTENGDVANNSSLNIISKSELMKKNADYYEQLKNVVESRWKGSLIERIDKKMFNKKELTVTILMQINIDTGIIDHVHLVNNSGDNDYDYLVKESVVGASTGNVALRNSGKFLNILWDFSLHM